MRENEEEGEMETRANFAEETVPKLYSEFAVLYDLFKVRCLRPVLCCHVSCRPTGQGSGFHAQVDGPLGTEAALSLFPTGLQRILQLQFQ